MSRAKLAELDLSDVAAVCISYFPGGHSRTRLRYLIGALHQHTPRVPLIVGAWQAAAPAEAPGVLIAAPDAPVASLRQAVDACIELGSKGIPVIV